MPTTIKSSETLQAELITYLRAKNRRLDTGANSLSKDFVLTPNAVGGKAILDQVAIARDLHILSRNAGTDVDNAAGNYTLERGVGRYAVVILTYYSNELPTTDIIIDGQSRALTAGTAFVSPVGFSTVGEARFVLSDMPSYYSYDRDRYEFMVIALCDDIGSIGNVGIGYINQIVNPIAGVSGVTNRTAASGGEESEIDDDFKSRIKLKKTGRDINTVNGLRKFIKDQGFTDAYPIRIEDADAERVSGIDVFVIDPSSQSITETFTYSPATARYYLANRPVLEITSVVASSQGTLSTSMYDVFIDNTSPLRRSVQAQDYIEIRNAASMSFGETFVVTYTYSSAVKQVQDTLALITNNILTQNALIKRGYPLYLYINATLTLHANADGPATRNKARSALAQLLTYYRFGDDIQKSDLVVVLQQGYGDYPIDGVDAVVINSYYLVDEFGNTYQPLDQVISVGKNQYVLPGALTIL